MRQHVCAYCCFSSAHSSLLYADDNDDGLFIELYCVALVFGNASVQRLCSKNQIFFIDICARYKSGLAFKKKENHLTGYLELKVDGRAASSNCSAIYCIMVSHLSRLYSHKCKLHLIP